MMKINEIWNELENDKSLTTGLLLRRYSAAVLPDVYVALQQPENIRCIAFRVRGNNPVNLARYTNLKDITLVLVPDDQDKTRSYLLVKLLSKQHKDVFSTLCEDLINEISALKDDSKLQKELLNRFEKWKSLFERADLEGLTPEEQRGLYGELHFLRKWLRLSADKQHCVQAWLGPELELRDFQWGGWAVEVKTTHGNNHQKIQINSERQLDTTNLDKFFLYHASLESQRQHGETLNQIIDSLIALLSEDTAAEIAFRSRLLQGGYYFHHAKLYEGVGYQIRQESFYAVRDNFPRIEEKDVRSGVGDVKYSIILSEYNNYKIDETSVFETLNQHGR